MGIIGVDTARGSLLGLRRRVTAERLDRAWLGSGLALGALGLLRYKTSGYGDAMLILWLASLLVLGLYFGSKATSWPRPALADVGISAGLGLVFAPLYLIALYEFKEGSGTVAHDTSGQMPPIDLTLRDDVTWMSSWGVDIENGSLIATAAASQRIYDVVGDPTDGTQQYTIEAWITPDNIDQGADNAARIVTYSGNGSNFMLAQREYKYQARTRTVSASQRAQVGSGSCTAMWNALA